MRMSIYLILVTGTQERYWHVYWWDRFHIDINDLSRSRRKFASSAQSSGQLILQMFAIK